MGRRKVAHILTPRDEAWIVSYRAGDTLQTIGGRWGVTRERVRQRLAKHGITQFDGGWRVGAADRAAARESRRVAYRAGVEQRFWARWGMSKDEARAISPLPFSHPHHPFGLYGQQRNSARRRHIGWEITFPEWWAIWSGSGRWEHRGRGQGYCMARLGDVGPYAVGNVYICTIGQNASDSYITKPGAQRYAKMLARQKREAAANA